MGEGGEARDADLSTEVSARGGSRAAPPRTELRRLFVDILDGFSYRRSRGELFGFCFVFLSV